DKIKDLKARKLAKGVNGGKIIPWQKEQLQRKSVRASEQQPAASGLESKGSGITCRPAHGSAVENTSTARLACKLQGRAPRPVKDRRASVAGTAGPAEIIGNKTSVAMASSDVKPKSISRAKKWSEEIENLYRFQQAGYRDEIEYKQVKQVSVVDRWPETGYVKKLQRRDNTFYYYNKQRECDDKEVHKVKIYAY
uniref:MEIG1 protein n=1 Tax=Sus scrofa TaxID=9823 RepID=A0A8D1DVD0_PIG